MPLCSLCVLLLLYCRVILVSVQKIKVNYNYDAAINWRINATAEHAPQLSANTTLSTLITALRTLKSITSCSAKCVVVDLQCRRLT